MSQQVKVFEILDRGTFKPMMAIRLNPSSEAERYLLARAGFGRYPGDQCKYVMLCELVGGGGKAHTDIYGWDNRTTQWAQKYINEHFDELEPGAVIDVEFIAGETQTAKLSEAVTTAPPFADLDAATRSNA